MSRSAFALLATAMVLVAGGGGMLMSFDVDAWSPTEGSGTSDDPYSGIISNNGTDTKYNISWLDGKYFLVGTEFQHSAGAEMGSYSISPGFGLSISALGISGVLSKSGVIEVNANGTKATFYAIDPIKELIFESNPSDGKLTFMGAS